MNSVAHNLLSFLVDASIKATIVIALVAVIALFMRRSSSAARHFVWVLGLGSALLITSLSPFVPHYSLPIFRTSSIVIVATPSESQSKVVDLNSRETAPLTSGPVDSGSAASGIATDTAQLVNLSNAALSSPAKPRTSWAVIAVSIWLAGAVAMFGSLAASLVTLRKLVKDSELITAGPIFVAAADARSRFSGLGPVSVRQALCYAPVRVPIAWGVRNWTILLPADADQWPAELLRAALLHELAHRCRRDWPVHILTQVMCALYWFHPMVWLALGQSRAEAERACDDLVLSCGVPSVSYAGYLVQIATLASRARILGAGAVAMAYTPHVEGRIRGILMTAGNRRALTSQQITLGGAVATLLTLPLIGCQTVNRRATIKTDTVGQSVANTSVTQRTRVVYSRFGVDYRTPDSYVSLNRFGTIFSEHDSAEISIPAANGTEATLANGYHVSLIGITRQVNTAGTWTMGGPSWRADTGATCSNVLPNPIKIGGWTVQFTQGKVPVMAALKVMPPAGKISSETVDQFVGWTGTSNPDWMCPDYRTVEESTPGIRDAVGAGFFPEASREATVRFGLAAGPWRTVAAVPFNSKLNNMAYWMLTLDDKPKFAYMTRPAQWQTRYFLGKNANLPFCARRFVAVEDSGRSTVLAQDGGGVWNTQLTLGGSEELKKFRRTGSDRRINFNRVKTILLQTRPYSSVEFQHVKLNPAQ